MDTMYVPFAVPPDVFSVLRIDADSFLSEMRLATAAMWCEICSLSQLKTAELAHASRAELLLANGRLGGSPFQ